MDIHPTARLASSVAIWGQMPIRIGADTFVGHDVIITGADARIDIGENVDIAPRVCIVSGTHRIDTAGEHSAGEGLSKPILIGDGVWIGAGSLIIGGVTIGRKAVIGAGSVVVSDIPPLTVAVGHPARPIKKWDEGTGEWIRWDTPA